MQGKRILITGGAGFIGRAVVNRCLDSGYRVAVIDNLCAGRLQNLAPFLDRIEFHETSILDATRVGGIMAAFKPDTVVHLAAHHFIPFCNQHPQETLRVNVEGTHIVLSEAARHGAKVAVVASSGAIYPDHEGSLGENLVAAPGDIYGLSKALSENVAQYISGTTGLACVSARLFNTYGPYETNPHLIPEIVASIAKDPVIRLGNIHTRRDYIYVEDVAELLCRCAEGAAEGFTTVNVGTGVEYSAEEIVQLMGQILGRTLRIEIDPARVRNVDKLHQIADTRRLTELTGMRPSHSLLDGLRKLLMHERLLAGDDV